MTDALVVLTTVESREDGERLARALVEARLAACVQILPPMTSIYRWQGAIQQASEHLLLLKTTRDAYPRLAAEISALHPYQTPELVALPVESIASDYWNWLTKSLLET